MEVKVVKQDKLIDEDDLFRNQRFKLVSHVVKGPWVVKAAAENFEAFVVGKAAKCSYHRGANYFEIDIDLSSSVIMAAVLQITLRYIRSLTIDIGLVVEGQKEDELPERLIGAVRICHMELSSAFVVDDQKNLQQSRKANYD